MQIGCRLLSLCVTFSQALRRANGMRASKPYQQKDTFIGQITAITLQIMALASVNPEIT
jgi:hypothetical protein